MAENLTGNTGTTNEIYNVVSILYHASQGAETYAQFISDAEQAGDKDLVQFFRDTKADELWRSKRAKQLLVERLK
jgi:rubrerythrin